MAMGSSVSYTGGGLGGYATSYDPRYGGKPTVPDPYATASSAIGANIANMGKLETLASGLNAFNQKELLNQYETAIPGYSNLTKQAGANTQSQLEGQVSSDVVNQILQNAAERGIMTGSPGSANANAAMLRALGLTSLGLQQTGQQNLIALEGAAPVAQPFDVSKLFISPDAVQSAQMAANLYASAPDPAAAAQAAQTAASGASVPRGTYTLGPTSQGGGGVGAAPTQTGASYVNGPWASDVGNPTVPSLWNPSYQTADPYASWNQWASGIPTTSGTGTGNTYMGGNWTGVNPADYQYAEGTPGAQYDYASMFQDAGAPYTDYSSGDWSNYDWSQFE